MKKPQVTTTSGLSGLIGIWLAVFGSCHFDEVAAVAASMTVERWAQILVPTAICLWSTFVDEDSDG